MRAIAAKDVRASRRDARIVVLLLLPLVLAAVLRGSDSQGPPPVTIAVAGQTPPTLAAALRRAAGSDAQVSVEHVDAATAAHRVRVGDADIALLAAPGFAAALGRSSNARLTAVVPRSVTGASAFAAALLEPALREAAREPPPAQVTTRAVPSSQRDVITQLGRDRFTLLLVVVYLIANVALIILPTLVAEEQEQGTLDALLLAGSPLDVAAAKALVGVGAAGVMLVLTVNFGGVNPADSLLFGAAALLLAFALSGFGLLLGVLLKTSARVNTVMGILILPAIAPAALIGISLPAAARIGLSLTPTAAAVRLLANGLTGATTYANPILAAALLAAWGAAGYLLLARALERRQA